MQQNEFDVVIAGGGPAGSIAGTYLARKGFSVCIIEKKQFPREVLCGEFLSREVLDILTDLGLREDFLLLEPHPISSFRFCPDHPRTFAAPLPFTGYGLKRGAFDLLLWQAAQHAGAVTLQPAVVDWILRKDMGFDVSVTDRTGTTTIRSEHVIAAYGRYNTLDRTIRKNPPDQTSSLNGIKFHVPNHLFVDLPQNEIQIFVTDALYCGVNVVDEGTATVCFLEKRSPGDLRPRERLADLIRTNRHFRRMVHPGFAAAIGSFPIYGASNIYFGKKSVSEDGVLMIGDAAQVIAPLAGDGIGMAMQSGKMAAESIEEGRRKNLPSNEIGYRYDRRWHAAFRQRLWTAGMVQKIFLTDLGRAISPAVLSVYPGLLSSIIKRTRG